MFVAIFDDISAIIIIALFYAQDLSTKSLAIAAISLVVLFISNRCAVNRLSAYILVGVWAAVLKSGVRITLAGFVVAWFIPLNVRNEENKPLLPSLEHALQPWAMFFILPAFCLCKCRRSANGY